MMMTMVGEEEGAKTTKPISVACLEEEEEDMLPYVQPTYSEKFLLCCIFNREEEGVRLAKKDGRM